MSSIGNISSGNSGFNFRNVNDSLKSAQHLKKSLLTDKISKSGSVEYSQGSAGVQLGGGDSINFGDLIKDGIQAVDSKIKQGDSEVRKVMSGESNNIHQSMIAIQESSVAFNLLVETRNQVMNAFQELTKMNV